jgi:hypothetical protein
LKLLSATPQLPGQRSDTRVSLRNKEEEEEEEKKKAGREI